MELAENTLKALWIDYAAVNKLIDIRDVIKRYSASELRGKGNIRCPAGQHKDKKPSAKIYTDSNACKCFSCGGYWRPLQLYNEIQGVSAGDYSAAKKSCLNLLEDFGIPLDSVSNINEINHALSAEEKAKAFPFTVEEIRLIGLNHPYTRNVIVSVETPDGEDFSENIPVTSLVDFYRADKENCLLMIAHKCCDRMFELTALEKELMDNILDYEKHPKDLEIGRAIYTGEKKPLFKKQNLLGTSYGLYVSAQQALDKIKSNIKQIELIMEKVDERIEQKNPPKTKEPVPKKELSFIKKKKDKTNTPTLGE